MSGCASMTGGACRYRAGETTLRLWAAVHPDAALELRVDGALQAIEPVAVDHGQRVEVALARPGLRALELSAEASAGRWRLELAEEQDPRPADVLAIEARWSDGDPEAALAELDALLAAESLTTAQEAAAVKLQGDILFARNKTRQALESYARAMPALEELGWLRAAGELALTATYICVRLHDFACARAWIERHAGLLERDPEARLVHSYYRGLVSDRSGDPRAALRDYRAHATYARRLGRASDSAAALSAQGVLLARLGDPEGAAAAFAEAMTLRDELPAEERGRLLINLAWVWIGALSVGREAPDPIPLLDESLAIFGLGAPLETPRTAADIRLNRALTWILRGDTTRAAEELAAVTAEQGGAQAMWRGYLEAELAGLDARWEDALAGYRALERAAARQDETGLRWRAAVGEAESLAALGRRERALARFRDAEALLERLLPRISMDAGRERFAADHDRGTRGLVELLLELGRADEALCAARLARARTYAALSGQESARHRHAQARYQARRAELEAELERSWTLPRRAGETLRAAVAERLRRAGAALDSALAEAGGAPVAGMTCAELRPPAPGELLLAYHRSADDWIGFAADGSGVTARRLDLQDVLKDTKSADALAAAGARALEPFADELARARRVRVIATGALLELPFHALTAPGGGALLDRVIVEMALDLAPRDGGPVARGSAGVRSRRALIVAPPSNLPEAAGEAARVDAALEARGLHVEALLDDDATGARARARTSGAALLHYVGHARADGLGGWGSALELAGDSSLGVVDVLALGDGAPAVVVLNGCSTGLADPRTLAGGMSLAHAFLVAGARVVVATSAEVDDAQSAAIIDALYRRLADDDGEAADGSLDGSRDDSLDVAAALRGALLETRAGRGDWVQYRAWVR